MIPLEDKQRVLLSGLHLFQKKISRAKFQAVSNPDFQGINQAANKEFYFWLRVESEAIGIYGSDYHIATKLNHNEYKRVRRLKEKMEEAVLSSKAIFLTLTFSNDTLAETSSLTRRRYVSRFLKSQSDFYIANIDFGDDKGREHYHAVLIASKVNYEAWRPYGAINGKKVAPTKRDNAKISKYVAKLSNHAIKTSTKQVRLIYSR